MTRKLKGIFLIIVIVGIFLFWYFNRKDYPNPTAEYYVNDFANALSPATKHNIVEKGEILYDYYKDVEGNGGAQIVVATFLLEEAADMNQYDPTDIFNQWKIGKNDMGLLIVLYFINQEYEGYQLPEFYAIDTAIGYQMKQYLTASRVGAIVDATILTEEDFDMGIAKMLHEFLWIVTEKAYGYEEFQPFNEEGYQEYFDNYIPDDSKDIVETTIWSYIFSSSMTLFEKIIMIGAVVFVVGGSGLFIINRGGGGASGGAGIFRRRR